MFCAICVYFEKSIFLKEHPTLHIHVHVFLNYDKTFFKSHSTSECDSSDQAVAVVVLVVVVVGMNFFGFSTSSLEPLHGFGSNFVWMFLGWTPTKFI